MAVSGGIVEYFPAGAHPTYTIAGGQSVTAGRIVEFTAGRTVQHAGAGSNVVAGIALQSGSAGDKIAVAKTGTWPGRAGGAITAGMRLKTGAAGVLVDAGATPDARQVVAYAEEDISNGADGPVTLLLG